MPVPDAFTKHTDTPVCPECSEEFPVPPDLAILAEATCPVCGTRFKIRVEHSKPTYSTERVVE